VENSAVPSSGTNSAWAPFRHRLFAAMWGAQFISNIGGWMQTVAAQWLMLSLTTSAAYVALVQTAAGLPVVLFAAGTGQALTSPTWQTLAGNGLEWDEAAVAHYQEQ
jgi:Transmembrane secretion effector